MLPSAFIPAGVRALVGLLLLGLLCRASAEVNPALPNIPERVFSVTAFGAVGDGMVTNTEAFQAAIQAASTAGGGRVEVPAGTYLCGPIQLASRIELHLAAGAILRLLPLTKYPGGTVHPANFISGDNLHDVAITGAGAIDGQGAPWWPYAKVKGAARPRLLAPGSCQRLLISGITLSNSPMFHIALGGKCSDVTVRGVTIRAPASNDPLLPSHNTDACDVKGRNIRIENCDVSVGDDNFTCGGNTTDVLITNCHYRYGHGVSIGSYTQGVVSNITVIGCTFQNTECGIRIKSDRDRGGYVHDLKYLNLTMTNVDCPILVYGAYMVKDPQFRNTQKLTPELAATYPAAPVTPLTPIYRDLVFSNITATVSPGRRAGLLWGLPEMNISNVTLDHVTITADKSFGVYSVQGLEIKNCHFLAPGGVAGLVTNQVSFRSAP
ncbi:MAG TPA: glycosyl hydrolase family 28 protein [Verrucomicrobiae bacterium]